MKRTVSLLLIFSVFIMTLCSCGFVPEKPALVILDTEISREIYNYYLDKVTGRPGDYGLPDDPDNKELKETAVELCKKYLALNTSFAYHQLKLSISDKVRISDNVNNHWIRFQKHYKKIGVSKPTLTKVFTADAYEDAIFTAIYDKGVSNEAGEAEIKYYFYNNYVAFRCVCVYFTKSDGSSMTEAERQQIKSDFSQIESNSGSDVASFLAACTNAGYSASDIVVLSSKADGYPDGFFSRVLSQEQSTVEIMTYGDCIFAVRKESLKALGEGLYAGYRDTLVEEMHANEWQQKLDEYIELFKVEQVNV